MANIDLLYFSGGLQTTTSSFLRKDDQLELAVNVHFDNIGSVTKRLGYSEINGSVTTSTPVRNMFSYARQANGTQNLFAVDNGTLSYYDGTNKSSVTSGLTSTAIPEFRVFVDQLYMVGANSTNVYLTPANITATTYSTTTNLSGAPTGARFIETFQNKLYMADVTTGGTRYPSRWYRSSVPDASGNITWTSTDFEEVYTDNGEPLKGMHTNKTLNQLLFFKENSLHAWDNFRLKDVAAVGTTAHRSIVTVNYTTFFWNEKGMFAYSGSEPTMISRPIQKWVDGISDYTTLFSAGFENRVVKTFVGDVTVDGVTYSNCEFVYSILDNSWTIYSYFDTFTCYATHKESGIVRVYGGTSDGEVHKFAARSDAVYSDDGNPIAAQFMTKAFDLSIPSEKKFVDRILIYTTRGQNLQGRMRVRGRDWSTYFPINESEESVSVNPEDGRFLQFHFSESSTNIPFILEGLSFSARQTTHNYAK
jgi:hypothetical protein